MDAHYEELDQKQDLEHALRSSGHVQLHDKLVEPLHSVEFKHPEPCQETPSVKRRQTPKQLAKGDKSQQVQFEPVAIYVMLSYKLVIIDIFSVFFINVGCTEGKEYVKEVE